MENINLTIWEKMLLEGINNSNYGDKIGDSIWTGTDESRLDGKIKSGVYSSLTKKGLIGTDGKTIWLTDKGIKICVDEDLMGKFK